MSERPTIRAAVLGAGNVTRAFLGYWSDSDFGLDLRVVSVLRKAGVWRGDSGTDLDLDALDYASDRDALEGADLVIESLPSVYPDGEPATGLLRDALDRGIDVLTVDKGPLVAAYSDLARRGRASGARFRSCVGGALPAIDVAMRDLRGSRLVSVRAVLNGTTNFILTEMEAGRSFDDALDQAIAKGIAEPDPAQDLDGIDTAAKMIILVNAIAGTDFRLDDVRVEGIRNIDQKVATSSGKVWRLVGTYDGRTIQVGPRLYGKDDLFYRVRGTEKAVEFQTEEMGRLTVFGGASGRMEMAAAMTRDILNMYL